MTMPEFFVIWYDDCGVPHDSLVYFVDPIRDRFLVAHEDKTFRWISTIDCELKEKTVVDVVESMNEEQKNVIYALITQALEG